VGSDDLAYAIKISPEGWVLLCSAAGIEPPEWKDREWPEPMVQSQTWGLARKNLFEVISEEHIMSRRPLLCPECGGTFEADQFMRLRRSNLEKGLPDPNETLELAHEVCIQGQ
jgi:hypothetical protein